jgi:hypothetical protein
MVVYIIGFTSYGIMLAFYAAVFPRLARNTRNMRELREIYSQGRITAKVYEQEEALEKSKISSLSMARAVPSPTTDDCDNLFLLQAARAAGYITLLSLDLSLLLPLKGNPKVNNYVVLL